MKKLLIATVCSALASTAAIAATTNGNLGATSTAFVDVNVDVLEEVRITGVAAMNLLNDQGSNTVQVGVGTQMSATTNLCLYYNNNANVQLNIDSLNGLTLTDGTDSLSYALNLDTNGDGTYDQAVTDGTTYDLASAETAATTTGGDNCNANANSTNGLQAIYTVPTTIAVGNGTYTDEVTLLLTPDPQ